VFLWGSGKGEILWVSWTMLLGELPLEGAERALEACADPLNLIRVMPAEGGMEKNGCVGR